MSGLSACLRVCVSRTLSSGCLSSGLSLFIFMTPSGTALGQPTHFLHLFSPLHCHYPNPLHCIPACALSLSTLHLRSPLPFSLVRSLTLSLTLPSSALAQISFATHPIVRLLFLLDHYLSPTLSLPSFLFFTSAQAPSDHARKNSSPLSPHSQLFTFVSRV
ncbi:unnamed protein product [Mortierella alpina]